MVNILTDNFPVRIGDVVYTIVIQDKKDGSGSEMALKEAKVCAITFREQNASSDEVSLVFDLRGTEEVPGRNGPQHEWMPEVPAGMVFPSLEEAQKYLSQTVIRALLINSRYVESLTAYLGGTAENLVAGDDTVWTVPFPDGSEVDIALRGVEGAAYYADATLYDSRGTVLLRSAPSGDLFGVWGLDYNGKTYVVDVRSANLGYKECFRIVLS